MKRLLVVCMLTATSALAAACFAPPTPTTTTTTTSPPALPVSPKMLTEPVGAGDLAVLSEVQGVPELEGFHLSTSTWQRPLDMSDDGDLALLLEELGRVDPVTGRTLRASVDPVTDERYVEVCDSVAAGADCETVPDSVGFLPSGFSPDGSSFAIWAPDPDDGPSTLRLVDGWTGELLVEVSASSLSTGVRPAWSPDSAALAFVLDGEVVTLAAATGAVPVTVMASDHVGPESLRQALTVIGWSAQGRIVSLWAELDAFGWPSLSNQVLQSIAPTGDDRRELGPVDPRGFAALSPDGSVVLSEPVDATDGTDVATGAVPFGFSDEERATRIALSQPWTGGTENGFAASRMSVLGFVLLPG